MVVAFPSVSFFCVEGAICIEGTASFDGAKCVDGGCEAAGIPTTCKPVTLWTRCFIRFGVDTFPGGKHRSCASIWFSPC